MSWFMVDVEANGPVPGLYSMTEIGVIRVDRDLWCAPYFHGKLQPLPGANWGPNAYAVVKYDHEHPVDDARGNAEALLTMVNEMKLKMGGID